MYNSYYKLLKKGKYSFKTKIETSKLFFNLHMNNISFDVLKYKAIK